MTPPQNVEWRDEQLFLLDQTLLPQTAKMLPIDTLEAAIEAIQSLRVRGAPAIGIAAAYALCVGLRDARSLDAAGFVQQAKSQAQRLIAARPTAVNLAWALERMCRVLNPRQPAGVLWTALVAEAVEIHAEDRRLCRAIGEAGVALIGPGSTVLTHCNAGALATGGIGTATAPMYLAAENGVDFKVLSAETRPLLQGGRLTAWELQRAGIDVSLIIDGAAAGLMAAGAIDLVIVGSDRVAANGDVANKVGTLAHALAAKHFGIPFYVALPHSTIDIECAGGADIPIEQRHGDEVLSMAGQRIAAPGIAARNPAFDITPAALVTALITDCGMIHPPFGPGISAALANRKV